MWCCARHIDVELLEKVKHLDLVSHKHNQQTDIGHATAFTSGACEKYRAIASKRNSHGIVFARESMCRWPA
jgi:hypothetical protein